jgi:hypothetical protein
VLFQAGGIGLDALQNAGVKRMEKIAVAEEKADHFSASFENPAGLRIRAESETPNGLEYSCAGFPAYLSARIQHARDRSDAYGGSPCNVANGRLPWNCFHADAGHGLDF